MNELQRYEVKIQFYDDRPELESHIDMEEGGWVKHAEAQAQIDEWTNEAIRLHEELMDLKRKTISKIIYNKVTDKLQADLTEAREILETGHPTLDRERIQKWLNKTKSEKEKK